MRVDFYESGQVITISNASDTYTLGDDEVMISNTIYKKKNLRSGYSTALVAGDSGTPANRIKLNMHHMIKKNSAIGALVYQNVGWDEIIWNGGTADAGLQETMARISLALKQ